MGNAPATIDDKGRLKVPQAFRQLLEPKYGRELFVTSISGDYLRLYPMPVWMEILQKLAAAPSTDPSKLRFLERTNYFGASADLDTQGRVLIPVRLRDSASMSGEVDVLGQISYLEVWNHDRLASKMSHDPFSDADARRLSELGI